MRTWPRSLLRLLLAVLFLSPCIELITPADAYAGINHAVTFAQNDNPNDQVATSETSSVPEALTLFANLVPAFTNSTDTFTGWNTSANGTGVAYTNGEIYSFTSDIVLYAQWSAPFHTVTFAENDSQTDSVVAQQTENTASPLTRFSALSPSFQNPNHSFSGWNTSASGGGSSYTDGSSYSFSADMVLYAQWSPITTTSTTIPTPADLVINFEADGASGVLNSVTFAPGSLITLPLGSTLSYPGFTFAGWFTSSVGGQLLGQGGATLTPYVSETAFAQWVATPPAVLSFSSNLGTGSITKDSGVAGTTVTVPGSSGMVRAGFVFSGWNTAANDSGTNYVIGSQFTLNGTSTLYAQWSKVSSTATQTVLIGSVGPFSSDSTQLSNVLRAQIRAVAAAVRSKKFATIALYGYDSGPGSRALHMTLSTQRALRVVEYLRSQLAHSGDPRIRMLVRGEGEISGFTAAMFRRVEIFAN